MSNRGREKRESQGVRERERQRGRVVEWREIVFSFL